MLSFFHKYSMITDEIKFIQTDKEDLELQVIQESYPNSIIYVKSNTEKNVYIGKERITENYNRVVKNIKNLTDNTLVDVYQGMIVYVVEDNSLYILLTDSDDRRWEKVSSKGGGELSSSITVAGLPGTLGANISNGTTYNSVEDILRDLLCKEIYPNVSMVTVNPTLSFGGINVDDKDSNYKSIMEVGSILNLGSVSLGSASISKGYRVGSGFTYGYSTNNDNIKDGEGNPPQIESVNESLEGLYTLTETYSPTNIGTPRTSISSEFCDDVNFGVGDVKIALGSNTISITATSPSGKYTHPEYPEYYVVSNLGKINGSKLEASSSIDGVLNSIRKNKSISITGVYPVYVNINKDTKKIVDDPIKMELTTSDNFEFDVPSEVENRIHFKFDYPATHTVTSFEIKDMTGEFVKYDATYDAESETVIKVIGGENISYKRFITTGKLQGEGTYKITLSKGLDE